MTRKKTPNLSSNELKCAQMCLNKLKGAEISSNEPKCPQMSLNKPN